MTENEAEVTISVDSACGLDTSPTVTKTVVKISESQPPPTAASLFKGEEDHHLKHTIPAGYTSTSPAFPVKRKAVQAARPKSTGQRKKQRTASTSALPRARGSTVRSRSASSGDGDIVLPARPQPYRQRVIPKTDSVDQDGEWTLFDDNGVSRYRCELCRKIFNSRSNLLRHLPNHWSKKPYECADCGQAFPRRGQLMQHIRSHQDDFPFKCSTCGKSFKWKQSLRRHHCTQTFSEASRDIHHPKSRVAKAPTPNACYLQSAIPVDIC